MPLTPTERLKRAHDLEMIRRLVMRLRLRELRNLTMTAIERAEARRLSDELEKDYAEAWQDDWMP